MSAEVLIPAAAGLLGALIGGAASLLATRSANKHALRMLRLQRREAAADDALGALWQVITTDAPEPMTVDQVLNDPKVVMKATFDLANRCAGEEPHVQSLCHAYAWMADLVGPWSVFRDLSGALSVALTHWRTNPEEFHKQQQDLGTYLAQLGPQMAYRDALKAMQRGDSST